MSGSLLCGDPTQTLGAFSVTRLYFRLPAWGYGVLLGTRSKTPLEVPGAQTSLFVEGFLGQITLGSRGLSAPGPARETNLPLLSRPSLALTFNSVLNFFLQLQTPASNCLLSTSAQCLTGILDLAPQLELLIFPSNRHLLPVSPFQ